ncbi:MAG: hypothetical protein V7607_2635 [Solirubrobacteraceae bacterium]
MQLRRIGDTDLEVSALSLGSWLTYAGGIGRDETRACTKAAFDLGITSFDTANAYGRGAAEQAWGDILSDYPRQSYTLATKAFFPMSDTDRGLSRSQVHKQIDASLRRLGVDYVDLFWCHRYDEETPLQETMQALTEVVSAGKARYIGFCEWPADRIRAALELPGVTRFVASQPQYSLLWREPEREVMALCARNAISQITWSPLAQGVLTGKYLPGVPPPSDSRAANDEMNGFIGKFLHDETLTAVQRLRPVAAEAGLTMSQLALAWVLRNEQVASAIIGASRPEQVRENIAAAAVRLSDDTVRAVDHALAGAPQPVSRA